MAKQFVVKGFEVGRGEGEGGPYRDEEAFDRRSDDPGGFRRPKSGAKRHDERDGGVW